MFARKLGISLGLIVGLLAPSAVNAEIGTGGRVDWATHFIADHQDADGHFPSSFGTAHAATADAVLAFVASGQGGDEVEAAMDWLEENVATADTLGKKAKIVMAAVASGRDPRDFGGENLVQDIRDADTNDDGVFDSSPFSQVLDQAYALLALAAADAPVERRSVRWLADAQCPVGGWQYDQPRRPEENRHCGDPEAEFDDEADTNTTSLVVQALAATRRSVPLGADPFVWFRQRQHEAKGGWGFSRDFPITETTSTSVVIQAFAAYDKRLPSGAMRALRSLQRYCTNKDPDGGFSHGYIKTENGFRRQAGMDLGDTVNAVLGLLKQPLPVEPQPYLEGLPASLPCDPIP